jgi:hypothetical protein
MFFLFAKTSTKQTYQIYVGPGFKTAASRRSGRSDGLAGVGIHHHHLAHRLEPAGQRLHRSGARLYGRAGAKPGDGCGILTITIDMSNLADLLPVSSTAVNPGLCKPEKFCTASGTTCGCVLDSKDPLFSQCTKACGQWAVKDVDFPDAGAYGFSFTLPQGFTNDDLGLFHRPTPTTFAGQKFEPNFNWLTSLVFDNTTVPANGAACLYSKVPGTPSCK